MALKEHKTKSSNLTYDMVQFFLACDWPTVYVSFNLCLMLPPLCEDARDGVSDPGCSTSPSPKVILPDCKESGLGASRASAGADWMEMVVSVLCARVGEPRGLFEAGSAMGTSTVWFCCSRSLVFARMRRKCSDGMLRAPIGER